ncbi:MAG: short-chain dehydrogenase [Robiginitomaculum sp.]|nr:MAG: short-chain dehydrogenase [Robiginitomaculum sp.]
MTKKIALITGGSRGLGRNTALHLAKKGVDVVLTYHSQKKSADDVVAEIEKQGGRAVALQLDTGDASTFLSFADKLSQALESVWGRQTFDYLVNNAGTGYNASFEETTQDAFDQLVNIHLKGCFFFTQCVLPMIADGGHIVNLSTGLTRFCFSGFGAYAMMKGGVEVLTRYLAKELGPRGIAVNTIAPGAIETDFGGGLVRDTPDVNQHIASMTAMGRVGLPDDIGGAISDFLIGDMHWITAQRIEISGGVML